MARRTDPTTLAGIAAWTYGFAMQYGVLRADDSTLRAIEKDVQTAEATSNDTALSLAEYTLGVALLNRDTAADRRRGVEVMMQTRDIMLHERALFMLPVIELCAASEQASRGERDAAIPVMRRAVDELRQAGRIGYGVWDISLLVETLLERGAEADVAEARLLSTGWRTCRPIKGRRCARSRCCGCALCYPWPAATTLPTGTS